MRLKTTDQRLAIAALLAGWMLFQLPRVWAQDQVRKVQVKVSPVYPTLARNLHISGAVNIQVMVSPAGTVKLVKPIGGHPLLIEGATEAVKKWKFEPGRPETTRKSSLTGPCSGAPRQS